MCGVALRCAGRLGNNSAIAVSVCFYFASFVVIAVIAIASFRTLFGTSGSIRLVPIAHGVTGSVYISIHVAVAADRAGVCGVASFGTGGIGDHGGMAVSLCRDLAGFVIVAVSTVAPFCTCFGAGGSKRFVPIAHSMTGGVHVSIHIAITANRAGMGGITLPSAGRLRDDFVVVMSESRGLVVCIGIATSRTSMCCITALRASRRGYNRSIIVSERGNDQSRGVGHGCGTFISQELHATSADIMLNGTRFGTARSLIRNGCLNLVGMSQRTFAYISANRTAYAVFLGRFLIVPCMSSVILQNVATGAGLVMLCLGIRPLCSVVVSECIHLVVNGGITATGTGVGRISTRRTRRSGHDRAVVMSERVLYIVCVCIVTSRTGVRGISTLGAGGSGHNGLVIVPKCVSQIVRVGVVATGTIVRGIAIRFTGRRSHGRHVIVTESRNLVICIGIITS